MTEDTAKAIEWMLANMTKAAEIREQQIEHKTILEKQHDRELSMLKAINKTLPDDGSLHSGEVVKQNL